MIGTIENSIDINFFNFDKFNIFVALIILLNENSNDIRYPITKLIDNKAIGNINAASITLKNKYEAVVIDQ